jgi:hypothetical protein
MLLRYHTGNGPSDPAGQSDHHLPAQLRDPAGDFRQLILFGVKSTSRLTKLKRTPRTPASCMASSSASDVAP